MQAIVRDIGSAAVSAVPFFSPEQIEIVRDTICKNASAAEMWLFVRTCERTRLDPFARQIHFVKRWDTTLQKEVGTHIVSIDGFRLIADRSGSYEGQTSPQWCGRDGIWREVWLASEPPAASRVGVLRRGFREPMWGIARYASYVQRKKDGEPNSAWERMSDVMLAKCAEALALRRAFPNDLSGLYTSEELGHAEADVIAASETRGATGSGEVKILSAALHEPDHETAPGPDTLASVMADLDACQTAEDVYSWIRSNARAVASEKDSPRKRDRWKRIQSRGAGVTPPVRKAELTRAFGEALVRREPAPAALTSGPAPERDPVDDLSSCETRESMLAWFSDSRDWLAGIVQGSQHERDVWNAMRATCERIGDPHLTDELSEMLG